MTATQKIIRRTHAAQAPGKAEASASRVEQFLNLIDKDLRARASPPDSLLLERIRAVVKDVEVDLDAALSPEDE